MAKKHQLNRCWKHIRRSVGEGYIEARENKPNQTIVATFVMGLGLMFGTMLVLSLNKSTNFESLFAAVVLTLLPIVWVLVVYRIPRGLRLYPEQLTAQRYRTLYGTKFFSKWFDLRDRKLVVQSVPVYSMEATDGKTKSAIALTGLFAAMGVFGWLLSLGVSNELQERQRVAYAIVIEGNTEPLALFLSRHHAEQAVAMFEAAKNKELDGYRSAPNRFEKRPGA